MVYAFQLNPFLVAKLELVSMLLIGFDRVFSLPIIATANIKSTGFPFPTLNNWSFGAPLLTLAILTLIFAEIGMLTCYAELWNYTSSVLRRFQVRFTSRFISNPLENRCPEVLPMHQVSDQLVESIIASPPRKDVDEIYLSGTEDIVTPSQPSSQRCNAPKYSMPPTRPQQPGVQPTPFQISSFPPTTLQHYDTELQSRSPPPVYSSEASSTRLETDQPSLTQPPPRTHQTDNIPPNTQPNYAQLYDLLRRRGEMDGEQADDSLRRNI
ncbi:hypothetical protein BGW37DRAFT_469326 [Umbelopsis sp. PMI_123]|nr:hypothetical protein BGW37DRAFT_469326 [Umbelopsis sp. PMI_123]